ncbi:MAG TPA: hypothetical protein VGJ96_14215 [Gemmatimonadaceae bacterium]|jgi:hypothetical protein
MRRYVQVSGTFLGFIAIAQLVRAVMQLPVQVADVAVPVWASWCAFLLASALAIWAWRTATRGT